MGPKITREKRILNLLQPAWPNWVPAPSLAAVSLQYSARIFALRKRGFQISNKIEIRNGVKHGYFRLGPAPIPSNREHRASEQQAHPLPHSGVLFEDISPMGGYED